MLSISRIAAVLLIAVALVLERATSDSSTHDAPHDPGRAKTFEIALSSLSQLCDLPAVDDHGPNRSNIRRHLSTIFHYPWNASSISTKLISDTSQAMCCALRSGSVWHQYAAARTIAAMGSASTTSRNAVCSVVGVRCSREMTQLAAMVHATHNASSDADLAAALHALSILSVCIPSGVIMPALYAGLAHPSRSVRDAAASSVARLVAETSVIGHGDSNHKLQRQLVDNLLDGGVLLLLLKSARVEPKFMAVLSALQSFFDDYTQEYSVAAQSMLVYQKAHSCRSILKAGIDASARRNESTASLLAWSHTRSAHWATESCPAPSNTSVIMFPCASRHSEPAPPDPCLEWHISFFRCNAHAQGTLRRSPKDASIMCESMEKSARRCDYAHAGYCGWDGTSAPQFSVVKRAQTWAGPLLFHAHDVYFRISLQLYGEWARGEAEFIMRFLPPGATVVDAGAHVGTISVALARQLGPSSTVIAIEATRFFASLARANAAAAGLLHMHVIHAALGDSSGCLMARSDHLLTTVSNIGGHAVIQCPEHVRRACAARNCAVHGETFFDGLGTYEWVPTMRVDDLGLQRCDVLKMDVEAMEGAVAQGARRTIETFKPMVFYEDNSAIVRRADLTSPSFMEQFGYSCYSRSESLWRSDNWAGSSRDVFGVNGNSSSHSMLFCVHPQSHMGPDSFFRE